MLMEVIVSASAIVVASATVGIYHRLDQLVGMVEKHDRTLYGEEGVETWDGLVNRVAAHEDELEKSRGDDFNRDEL